MGRTATRPRPEANAELGLGSRRAKILLGALHLRDAATLDRGLGITESESDARAAALMIWLDWQ